MQERDSDRQRQKEIAIKISKTAKIVLTTALIHHTPILNKSA